jgi:CBS domain-containing protein
VVTSLPLLQRIVLTVISRLLSERDIVRALAERGAGALTEPIARAMTRTQSTCTQSKTVNSVMESR